jgi:hypothetical protein
MKRKKESNKLFKAYFFEKISEDEYTCRLCQKSRSAKKGTGCSNLMEHLRTNHPNFEQLMKDHPDASTLPAYIDTRAANMSSWLDWIIGDGLYFATVEKESYRKYSNLEKISTETLMKYIRELTTEVEQEIKNILPDKFTIIFDGWTLDGTSTHFIAMFARFLVYSFWFLHHMFVLLKQDQGYTKTALLAFSPLFDESDFTAESHYEFMTNVLENVFEKSWDNVVCLSGDNCSTNKALATLAGKPLVGCYAHRFNLEVNSFLETYEILLSKVLSFSSHFYFGSFH